MHTRRTPRVAGLALFGTLAVSLFALPVELTPQFAYFMGAAVIVFGFGLMEDLGFPVAPVVRLLAAFAASLVVVLLLDAWLVRADIPGLDPWLARWAVGVPITLVLVAGITHAFNLIDGVHGLASWTAIVCALAMAMIAWQGGNHQLATLSSLIAACVFGFFLLNYPWGFIFLGDAGAYTLGFILSWLALIIILAIPEVTPWALLLAFFWPIADTALAVYRRLRGNGRPMAPDRLHVHQLLLRVLEIHYFGRGRRNFTNPLTGFLLFPFVTMPPVLGVLFWNKPMHAFVAVLLLSVLFVASYAAFLPITRRLRARAPGQPPVRQEVSVQSGTA